MSKGIKQMELTKAVFDDLDAYELRLYVYYKLTAQEGRVELPVRATAKGARLSVNKMLEARKSLEEKGYIEQKPRIISSGSVLVK